MVPKFESADRFKSKEISPTPAIMNSHDPRPLVSRLADFNSPSFEKYTVHYFTDIRPRMLYNCRVSFIMKYCTVFKLEIILSTESEMVWPCDSRAQHSARL